MKQVKKIVCLILAALCIVGVVACKSNKTEEAVTTANQAATVIEGSEEIKSGAPEGFSLNGRATRILCRNTDLRQMDVDGGGTYTGDVVFDAVYTRNCTVAELLGTTFEITAMDGDWTQFGVTMESSLMAGDDNWDIINAPGNACCTAQRDYLFQELQNSPYLSFENPYWNNAAMEEVSIDGVKIRYLVGDLSLSMHHYSGAVFFNKALFEKSGFDENELYQMVIDRQWTIEKLEQYAQMVFDDTNSNGITDDEDISGFTIFTTEDAKWLEYGADVRRSRRNADGIVEMDYDLDRANLAVDKLRNLLFSTPGARYTQTSTRNFDLFTGGHTVFVGCYLGAVSYAPLRNMVDPYGIVPFPMLDEKQAEYSNYIHNSAAYYCVPVTCKNLDDATAVLEALCFETYNSVIGVYFEMALKSKYASDTKTGECIDIIRAVSKKYFLAEHNTALDYGAFLISKQLTKEQNTLTSDYRGIVDSANRKIVELVEKIGELEN